MFPNFPRSQEQLKRVFKRWIPGFEYHLNKDLEQGTCDFNNLTPTDGTSGSTLASPSHFIPFHLSFLFFRGAGARHHKHPATASARR